VQQDPKVARILEDVQRFAALREDPAWRRLNEKVKADEEHFLVSLAQRQMAGEDVSQREIDFHRGWYRACRWLLGHPEQALDNLERAVRSAYLMTQLELDQAVEEDSPYL
jgi:hypothetical protein